MAPIVPTLRYERRLWNDGLVRVVGVDEVGDDGTAGRGDADFVHSDDPDEAVIPESALVAKSRDDGGHQALAYRNRTTPPGGRGRA